MSYSTKDLICKLYKPYSDSNQRVLELFRMDQCNRHHQRALARPPQVPGKGVHGKRVERGVPVLGPVSSKFRMITSQSHRLHRP